LRAEVAQFLEKDHAKPRRVRLIIMRDQTSRGAGAGSYLDADAAVGMGNEVVASRPWDWERGWNASWVGGATMQNEISRVLEILEGKNKSGIA
jgi:hypothetical protein